MSAPVSRTVFDVVAWLIAAGAAVTGLGVEAGDEIVDLAIV
jgi:hypothetical protein